MTRRINWFRFWCKLQGVTFSFRTGSGSSLGQYYMGELMKGKISSREILLISSSKHSGR